MRDANSHAFQGPVAGMVIAFHARPLALGPAAWAVTLLRCLAQVFLARNVTEPQTVMVAFARTMALEPVFATGNVVRLSSRGVIAIVTRA